MRTHPSQADIRQYGAPGSPIPGSRLYRGYCVGCGEPIRVVDPDRALGIYCRGCQLKPQTGGPPAPSLADGSDADGGQGSYCEHVRTQVDQYGGA